MRQKIIDSDKCTGCKSCELACIVAHSPNEDLKQAYKDGGIAAIRARCRVGKTSDGSLFPEHCRHCADPACARACMSGALSKNQAGYVVCDTEACVGCFMCVMSCPYGFARPATGEKRVMIKCDGCSERDCSACVEACPTGCLNLGDVDGQEDTVVYIDPPQTQEACR
ncbi:MAG: anaerobic carbon-monoxide dehydrogenase iron sulfur subunit [Desulfuromonadales bacterium]|jgi:carbon-monoxide dehydrogenase iron sulfur subunit|nr:anaerobic carbon-monoxide dehydrogenase iron sulfur subunit [Desulfuromonadales bacterium]